MGDKTNEPGNPGNDGNDNDGEILPAGGPGAAPIPQPGDAGALDRFERVTYACKAEALAEIEASIDALRRLIEEGAEPRSSDKLLDLLLKRIALREKIAEEAADLAGDGPDPGTELPPARGGRPCKVTVTLLTVVVNTPITGDDFAYDVNVQGRLTQFAHHTVLVGIADQVNREVFSGNIGACNTDIQLFTSITAHVKPNANAEFYDTKVEISTLACPAQSIQRIDMTVSVRRDNESESELVSLAFFFNVERSC